MKKILFSILLACASFICQAQALPNSDEVSIPSTIVDRILIDLHDYRDLKIIKEKQDSLIVQYEIELDARKNAIIEAKLHVDQYKELINRLELKAEAREKAMKQMKKKLGRLQAGHVVRTFVEILVIALVIAL
jgi:hypothetical protein